MLKLLLALLYCHLYCHVTLIHSRGIEIDTDAHVSFLADVRKYFRSTGIFLLYDDNSENFATPYNIAIFIKEFSRRLIRSQAIHYTRIKQNSSHKSSLRMQSLFVVFITSRTNFVNFGAATAERDMSHHTWLVVFPKFINDQVDRACHNPTGNPFHLVFNSRMIVKCHGSKRLKKWYSIFDNRTEALSFGYWSKSTGLVYRTENHYEKRFDLLGKKIKIATLTNQTSDSNKKMTGFFEDLFEELKNSTNFTVSRVKQEDAFGKYDHDTGKWMGLIGLLTEHEVDVVVAPMTLSGFRLEYVDFMKPLLLSRNRVYIRQPDNVHIRWSAYFRAFSKNCWAFLALTLIVASLSISFIRISVNESVLLKVSTNYVVEHFVHVLGILCQQGLPEFPVATPLRLAYFTTILLALIIWAVYSASITSYITVLTPSLPFDDPKGFAEDGSYKLIVLQNSSDYGYILSGLDPVLRDFKPLLKHPWNLPTDPFSGFQQVCEEKVGFYTSDANFKGVSGYIPCSLTYIETGQYECLTIALAKQSPYITSLNFNLRKLEDNGVVTKLKNWYFRGTASPVEVVNSPIGIESVAPLLTIYAIGLALSTLIFLLERLCHSRFERKINENIRLKFQNHR